jgi:hypothetical protein
MGARLREVAQERSWREVREPTDEKLSRPVIELRDGHPEMDESLEVFKVKRFGRAKVETDDFRHVLE